LLPKEYKDKRDHYFVQAAFASYKIKNKQEPKKVTTESTSSPSQGLITKNEPELKKPREETTTKVISPPLPSQSPTISPLPPQALSTKDKPETKRPREEITPRVISPSAHWSWGVAGRWSGYVNDWDGKFTFQCPEGQYIAGVASKHANHSEDRKFNFYCSDHLPTSVNKNKFTGYANDWDEEFRFQCPEGQYIAGVKSIHANHSEDRRFDFYCASYRPSPTPESGRWTDYVNDWDEPVLFTCEPGYYIAGIGSVHANHSEDRRFSFLCSPYYAR